MTTKISKLSFFVALTSMFLACDKDYELDERGNQSIIDTSYLAENIMDSEPEGITILGKKLDNPYSVSNMRKALSEIQKNGLSKAALDYEISANTLYIRFLPKDTAEMNTLLSDTTIELFDRPMDYEIESEGEYYHDPELPDSVFTWQYTSVPIDYAFPNIKYEILDTCFVPDDLPEDSDNSLSKSKYYDLSELLEKTAYRITGNESMLDNSLTKAKRGAPHGKFQIYEPDGKLHGLYNVKVRVYNFIRWDHTYTNVYGDYKMDKHYRTKVHYSIVFHTRTGIVVWGNLGCLNPAIHSMGWASQKDAFDRNFYLGSNAWNWGSITNATYHYFDLCKKYGITRPPNDIVFWAWKRKKGNWTGCTPMFQHGHAANATKKILNTLGLQYRDILPDIFIYKFDNMQTLYTTIFHELAHASHHQSVGRDYWNIEMTEIVLNGCSYGDHTTMTNGIVGVVEMWGNYFGEYVCYPACYPTVSYTFSDTHWFKPQIMVDLQSKGFTPYAIFKGLNIRAVDHYSYKKQLINLYPNSKNDIEKCFSNNGF